MALHRLNSVTIGVPNVEETSEFYRDFNLREVTPGAFASADGGTQLRLVPPSFIRPDDLAGMMAGLHSRKA